MARQIPRITSPPTNSGFFDQSSFGGKGNFELVVPKSSGGFDYYWRENDANGLPWHGPFPVATDTGKIDSLSLLQSNFGNIGNLELVARQGDHLVFFWREDHEPFTWYGPYDMPNSGGALGASAVGPSGPTDEKIILEPSKTFNNTSANDICKVTSNYPSCKIISPNVNETTGATALANVSGTSEFCKSTPTYPGCGISASGGILTPINMTGGNKAPLEGVNMSSLFCTSNPRYPGCPE